VLGCRTRATRRTNDACEGERREIFYFIKIICWESTVTMYIYMVTVSTSSSYPIFRKNFIKNIKKKPLTVDALYLDEEVGMNSNSLYIYVYYSFPTYYFNIKNIYLIYIGKREKVAKR
jgi:hypothetical protein